MEVSHGARTKSLSLNVSKTKEIIVDLCIRSVKGPYNYKPISITNEVINGTIGHQKR